LTSLLYCALRKRGGVAPSSPACVGSRTGGHALGERLDIRHSLSRLTSVPTELTRPPFFNCSEITIYTHILLDECCFALNLEGIGSALRFRWAQICMEDEANLTFSNKFLGGGRHGFSKIKNGVHQETVTTSIVYVIVAQVVLQSHT
jgi:hypothetical protein